MFTSMAVGRGSILGFDGVAYSVLLFVSQITPAPQSFPPRTLLRCFRLWFSHGSHFNLSNHTPLHRCPRLWSSFGSHQSRESDNISTSIFPTTHQFIDVNMTTTASAFLLRLCLRGVGRRAALVDGTGSQRFDSLVSRLVIQVHFWIHFDFSVRLLSHTFISFIFIHGVIMVLKNAN